MTKGDLFHIHKAGSGFDNQYNPTYQKAKEEKSYDCIN